MLHYTDELQFQSANELLFYRPSHEGKELTGTPTAALSVYAKSNETWLLENEPLVWNSLKARFEAELDISDANDWPISARYTAMIDYVVNEDSHRRIFHFTILHDPWRANLTTNDLLQIAPAAAYEHRGPTPDFEPIIREAEEEIRIATLARGFSAGLVLEKAALNRCHRLLTLALLYQRISDNTESVYQMKASQYRAEYEASIERTLSGVLLDFNNDGIANEAAVNRSGGRLMP